mmetsp:Transcript_18372/g.57839  ORF Transcript_18372/g.57839 Transcript_18372/m.57839 type:complete len:383 (+) Transcript_18372:210-1358(+)
MAAMMMNIAGTTPVEDPEYRYKMPRIVGKVEGRGNGIKTAIPNMTQVALALHRPPGEVTKFFGCELGAQTTWVEETERAIVNGAHTTQLLQDKLSIYIEKFVLCPSCRLPETSYKIRNEIIYHQCVACGARESVDMQHKLTTYILKQYKVEKKAKGEKKEKKKDKEQAAAGDDEAEKKKKKKKDKDKPERTEAEKAERKRKKKEKAAVSEAAAAAEEEDEEDEEDLRFSLEEASESARKMDPAEREEKMRKSRERLERMRNMDPEERIAEMRRERDERVAERLERKDEPEALGDAMSRVWKSRSGDYGPPKPRGLGLENLTPEQRHSKLLEHQQNMEEHRGKMDAWREKHEAYMTERRAIMDAYRDLSHQIREAVFASRPLR